MKIIGNLIQFTYTATGYDCPSRYQYWGLSWVTVTDVLTNKTYMLQSRENGLGFNTERAFAYLVNQAMSGIVSPLADRRRYRPILTGVISPWSGLSAYTFMTKNVVWDQLNPFAPVTNAAALSWISEARYPLLSFISTSDFHGALRSRSTVSGTLMGGAAVDTTYIKNYRALNPLGNAARRLR